MHTERWTNRQTERHGKANRCFLKFFKHT